MVDPAVEDDVSKRSSRCESVREREDAEIARLLEESAVEDHALIEEFAGALRDGL